MRVLGEISGRPGGIRVLDEKKLRWVLIAAAALVCVYVLRSAVIIPTSGHYFAGVIPPREVQLTLVDATGNPIEGCVVERRYDGEMLKPNPEIPARSNPTDDAGQTRVAVGCRDKTERRSAYLWGVVTHSQSEQAEIHSYFWNAVKSKREFPEIEYVVLKGSKELARFSERKLLQLPVKDKAAIGESVFSQAKSAAKASNDVEISHLQVKVGRDFGGESGDKNT
jgi:hypothetical protein